ncbi:alpha/beta hydrolase [Paragemmobacter ruber]|uniref:Alpha/beta hydrolase fold domain-containing protein n=1 Tax=Paragemmobacter ruber TaxID=1985673 RepID=A0ABW9Y6W0_9RHOB|nr:alpha/beta hydrolase [Rhodobacter ruber]NBE08127.1 alpha/beta hydrolase fold domain-containing protein [Rhodobacter ruber]
MRHYVLRVALITVVLAAVLFAAFRLSPWPSVLVLRVLFDRDAARAMAALEPRLPAGLVEHLDLAYGTAERERLDLILPPGPAPPEGWPVLFWVHGGAFVAGRKENVGNYLRLVSAQGYAAIAPNYTRAPTARHPRPTEEMLEALLWVQAVAADYRLDPSRIILAGDSAGSHIALQTAIALQDPAYARALNLRPDQAVTRPRGLALFCGIYDLSELDSTGAFEGFLHTVQWSYLGTPDVAAARDAALFSLFAHVPPNLPPLFLTAGNADPLLPQTEGLARVAAQRGIPVDALTFPPDHQPPLGHEYQFTLDSSGEEALTRLLGYLGRVSAPNPS